MNCQDMQKFIHVYLDGEFAEEDRRDFERHLASCEQCRKMARFESRFKAALKVRVPPVTLPEGLVKRIRARLESTPAEPSHGRYYWALRLVPAALAASALILLIWPHSHPGSGPTREVLRAQSAPSILETIARRGRRPGVASFVHEPGSEGHPIKQASFSSSSSQGSNSPFLFSKNGRNRVAVTVFDPESVSLAGLARTRLGNRYIYLGSVSGQRVAVFRHQGAGYAITTDLPTPELLRMVRIMLSNLTHDSAPISQEPNLSRVFQSMMSPDQLQPASVDEEPKPFASEEPPR